MNYQLYKHIKDNIYFFVEQKWIDVEEIEKENFETLEDKYKYIFEQYDSEKHIVTNEPMNLAFPILVDGKLREMTREEKILLLGHIISLVDGEYIEDNQIKVVEKPKNKHLNYKWDKEKNIWLLATSKEELLMIQKDLIMQYAKKEEDIKTLNKFAFKFGATDAVSLLIESQESIEKEIMEIEKIIQSHYI